MFRLWCALLSEDLHQRAPCSDRFVKFKVNRCGLLMSGQPIDLKWRRWSRQLSRLFLKATLSIIQVLDCSNSPAGDLMWARSWAIPSLLSTMRCSDGATRNREGGWEDPSFKFAPRVDLDSPQLRLLLNAFPHTCGLTNDSKPWLLIRSGFTYTLHLKSCGLDSRQWKPCKADGMIVLCPFVMILLGSASFSTCPCNSAVAEVDVQNGKSQRSHGSALRSKSNRFASRLVTLERGSSPAPTVAGTSTSVSADNGGEGGHPPSHMCVLAVTSCQFPCLLRGGPQCD